ncbi:MAG: glycosyltransferase family 4 protein [Actinobacteria bacterium]|nr:glycosyltransferase family 4 protein [Actinomycetota bacterium]
MRILVLNHNDQGKGTFFRCFFLSKYLCQHGNEVVLSCLNPDRNAVFTKVIQIEGVKVCLLAGQHGSSSLLELPFHILRALINIRLAVSQRFDVVYSFNVASPTTGLPLIFLRFLKMIGLYNAKLLIDWDDWWGKGGLTSIDKKGWLIEASASFLETRIPLLADRITVVSDMLEEKALQIGVKPHNISYLPNGANTELWYSVESRSLRKELGLPFEMNILCYVGRALTTFDYLINSISIVVSKSPNTVAIFIAPLDVSHIEKIKNLGLSENVIHIGVQLYEKILPYLKASDILLLPRANNKSEKANYPARLGDYLVAGRPIVATAIGEVEKVIRENKCGLLAKPDDPADFADKILELLNDPWLRENIGRRSYEVAEQKLSWRTITEQLMQDVLLK